MIALNSASELSKKEWVKEALLYEPHEGGSVRCGVCERRCVVRKNETGFCKSRLNIDGRLFTLTYGDISTKSNNPIEKKPFFHFWPGSMALTVGSYGCNFTCPQSVVQLIKCLHSSTPAGKLPELGHK